MATPLSLLNLMDGGLRTLLSISGISIAIVLIFMQLGFLGAVTDTAVVFYDKMKFDLLISAPDYYNFTDANRFSRNYLADIESVEGVKTVQPLHASLGKWNYESQNVQEGILILGASYDGTTFTDPELDRKLRQLTGDRSILVDRASRPGFLGATRRVGFGDADIGLQVELNQYAVQIADHFKIGSGLAAKGTAIMNESGFAKVFPGFDPDDVSLGLVQLQDGQDPRAVKRNILAALGDQSLDTEQALPVDVLTRDEAKSRETRYWMTGTPVGFIFIAGVVVAFVVGSIIVYIVLSADISKQIGEYATLKAMGYQNSFLARTVLEQSLVLAVISYVLAFFVSLVLYKVVGDLARLPIAMTMARQVIVFCSSLAMSSLSAVLAMRKLRNADPVDLF